MLGAWVAKKWWEHERQDPEGARVVSAAEEGEREREEEDTEI